VSSSVRVWLRRSTTLLILVCLIGITTLAVVRARRITSPIGGLPPTGNGSGSTDANRKTVGVYDDFKYVESIAGKIIFVLRSVRTLGLASGWHEIEDVNLELHADGDDTAVLSCDRASFNIETRDARLFGRIHIEFQDGAFVNTDQGSYKAASQRFVTDGEAVFSGGGAVGRAGRAEYQLPTQTLILRERAVIQTADGRTLEAPRIVYKRQEKQIELPQGGRITLSGGFTVEGKVGRVDLDDTDGSPTRLELYAGVRVNRPSSTHGSGVEGRARRITAARDGAGNWQISATTDGPWVEFIIRNGANFFERRIRTWDLKAAVSEGGLQSLRADRSVCLSEIPTSGPPFDAESRTAQVFFAGGEATDVELTGQVILSSDDFVGTGIRARMSGAKGLVMLTGDGEGRDRAVLFTDRARVSSESVQMFEKGRRAEATGNVQGRVEGVLLLGADDGVEEQALHFASDGLVAEDGGKRFHLKGTARAWQGDRFLLADEMTYDQDQQVLEAFGDVRTTVPASQVDPEADPSREILIVARTLKYDRLGRFAQYSGNVRFSDVDHTVSAAELTLAFDAEDQIENVEATGSVDIVDRTTGRRIQGQNARYETASQLIHVTGSPVQFTDEKGNVVSSSSLTLDRASGRVAVAGGTESIFHPEARN